MSRDLSHRLARIERRLAVRHDEDGEEQLRGALKLLTEDELDALLHCYDHDVGAWTGGAGVITDVDAERACAGLLKLDCGHQDYRKLGVSAAQYLASVSTMTDPRSKGEG